jgi:serine/threonine protein phosphatase PrpC
MNRRSSVVEVKQPIFTRYAALSKVGYVPFNPNKVNQDRAMKMVNFGGDESKALFGCFDGHGALGHEVSQYVSTQLPDHLLRQENIVSNPTAAITKGFLDCNTNLANSHIDCNFSGTTAIVCYLHGRKLYSCNVGDSRAVLAKRSGNTYRAIPLSDDQKPDRDDEKKRILENHGRVEACKGLNVCADFFSDIHIVTIFNCVLCFVVL